MKYVKVTIVKSDSKEAIKRINENHFVKNNIDCEGVNEDGKLEWVSGDSFDMTEQSDRDALDKLNNEIDATLKGLQYASSVEEELFIDPIGEPYLYK